MADDANDACLQALQDGKVSKSEFNEIQTSIQNNLQLPEVKKWFDGSYEVLNERDLLTSDKLLRPDRVMLSGDEAVVVDYKTGERQDKYLYQVKEYAKVLQNTGFSKVSGFFCGTCTPENWKKYVTSANSPIPHFRTIKYFLVFIIS